MKNIKISKGVNDKELLVCFAGIANRMGVNDFEFQKTLSKLNIDYIILKDVSKRWYHHGINDVITKFEDLRSFLKDKMSEYEKTYFLGSSAGGHAAILYGVNLSPDLIIAMSPQINISPKFSKEKRWMKERSKIINLKRCDMSIFKEKILKMSNLKIAVSKNCIEDIKQLKLIDNNLSKLDITYFDSREHNVAKIIKQRIGLENFITSEIYKVKNKNRIN